MFEVITRLSRGGVVWVRGQVDLKIERRRGEGGVQVWQGLGGLVESPSASQGVFWSTRFQGEPRRIRGVATWAY